MARVKELKEQWKLTLKDVENWERFLIRGERSQNTRNTYARYVKQFILWLDGELATKEALLLLYGVKLVCVIILTT